MKPEETTTIRISKDLVAELKEGRKYSRETYEEIIRRYIINGKNDDDAARTGDNMA